MGIRTQCGFSTAKSLGRISDLFVSKRFDFQKGFEAEEPWRYPSRRLSQKILQPKNSWCVGKRQALDEMLPKMQPSGTRLSLRRGEIWRRIWWWVFSVKNQGRFVCLQVQPDAKLSWCSRFTHFTRLMWDEFERIFTQYIQMESI